MGCGKIENGLRPFPALWRLQANSEAPGFGAINLTWEAPTWVKMLQVTANWAAVPTAVGEDLIVWKDHSGTEWDVDLLRVDPTALGLTDWVCLDPFVFEPGESARIQYANTDAQAVGVEIYFQQLDK